MEIGDGVAIGIGKRDAVDRFDDDAIESKWFARIGDDDIAIIVAEWIAVFVAIDFAEAFDGIGDAVSIGVEREEVGDGVAIGIDGVFVELAVGARFD